MVVCSWERKEIRWRRRLERGWGWELALFWEVRLVGEKRWWTVLCRMPAFRRQEEAEGTGQVGRDQTRPRRAYRKKDCVVHSTLVMEDVLLGTAQSVLTDTSAGTEGQDSPSSTAVSTRSQPCARPCAPDPWSAALAPPGSLLEVQTLGPHSDLLKPGYWLPWGAMGLDELTREYRAG